MNSHGELRAREAFWTLLTKHPLLHAGDLAASDSHGSALRRHFRGSSDDDRARRLSVYSNGYVMRILEVLEQEFEATAKLLGEDGFRECAWRYLRKHPSEDANLRWVGRCFADYLASPEAAAHQEAVRKPWVVDIARLEWARSLAFDAAQGDPLSFEQLTATAPEQWGRLQLATMDSLHLIPSEFDLEPLWHQLVEHECAVVNLDPPRTEQHVVAVWRYGGDVLHCSISPEEAAAVRLLGESIHLASFCEQLASQCSLDETQVARQALGYLSQWTQRGWASAETPD